MHRKTLIATAALITLGLVACGGDDDEAPAPAPTPVAVGDTVALTATGRLVSFNRATPATLVGGIAVSGLASGETLVGIDVRPADGLLYALSSAGRLYTVVPSTGVATLKATLAADAADTTAPYTSLTGDSFGVDFNPAADRLRVISNTGLNLRINVDTGATTTDGTITPVSGTAAVSAAGYTNSFAGTVTTQLFDLDVTAGTLHLQDPPNNGTLAAGLPLGAAVAGATAANGFDIDARTNTGYAALTVGGTTSLYTINLTTGAATVVAGGAIAGGEAIRGLALTQPAAPTAIGLSASNQLVVFSPAAPNTLTATTAVTGLGVGETLVGIDQRPQDGLIWGLARTTISGGKLYTIDPTTGAATFRADLIANPTDTADGNAPYSVLAGTTFSVDFNPAANRLRVISDTGQSLRIVVETVTGTGAVTAGWTITDLDINRVSAPASVVAAAYTSNFAGTATTTLLDIETNSNVLALQNPPNAGTLVDIGAIGFDVAGTAGFDIAGGGNGLALAALRSATAGPFSLYSINLTTGAATLRGASAAAAQIGGATGPTLIDLAIRY
jgi:hypothetical protein